MEVGKLTVTRRHGTGKGVARKLRATGSIPGVCYGAMLDAPISIAVNARALKASLDPEKRNNTVIDMTIRSEGHADQNVVVMVKDYQIHKLRRDLVHVDLVAIDTEKPVEVEVPITMTGRAKGLVHGGQLHTVAYSIEIRCKPADIPGTILADVSDLDIGGVLHVAELTMPEGVKAITPGHQAVITCTAPEAEEVAPEGEAAAEGASAEAPAEAPKEG